MAGSIHPELRPIGCRAGGSSHSHHQWFSWWGGLDANQRPTDYEFDRQRSGDQARRKNMLPEQALDYPKVPGGSQRFAVHRGHMRDTPACWPLPKTWRTQNENQAEGPNQDAQRGPGGTAERSQGLDELRILPPTATGVETAPGGGQPRTSARGDLRLTRVRQGQAHDLIKRSRPAPGHGGLEPLVVELLTGSRLHVRQAHQLERWSPP